MPHPQSLSNNQQKVFCAFTTYNYNVYFWSMLISVSWRMFIHWVTGLRKVGKFPQGSGIHNDTHKHRARYWQCWTRIDLCCLDNPSKTIIWSLLIPGYFQWLLTFLCSSPLEWVYEDVLIESLLYLLECCFPPSNTQSMSATQNTY